MTFCALLRVRTLMELDHLRNRFARAVQHEFGSASDYRNICWVCKADVETASNDQCQCGWLICADGACQCPDWSDGYKDHQVACSVQIERLGPDVYEALVKERVRLREFWEGRRGTSPASSMPPDGEWHEYDVSDGSEGLPDWDNLSLLPPRVKNIVPRSG